MSTQQQDVLLLAYIAFFGLLCAVLIIKEERLGWAMFTKNIAYAVAFAYGSWVTAHPEMLNEEHRRYVRYALAISITWAIYELVSLRIRRWRESRGVRQ